MLRCSHPEMFCRKGVLENFAKSTGNHLCQSLFFNKVAGGACNFIKKETLAQVFSCKFCEISKNTFSHRTPPVAASICSRVSLFLNLCRNSNIQETILTACKIFLVFFHGIFIPHLWFFL